MAFSLREYWTAIHGMALGFGFVLFFTASLALLLTLQPELLTPQGLRRNVILLKISGLVIAILSWLAVIVGTWIVYPWYRATPPSGTTDLNGFPRSHLLAMPAVSGWHNFGMEWKEHVAWLVPMAITMAAAVFSRYGRNLRNQPQLRSAVLAFVWISLLAAGIAGFFGAMINKHAPVEGGATIRLMEGAEK